jgi:hypothetical protein
MARGLMAVTTRDAFGGDPTNQSTRALPVQRRQQLSLGQRDELRGRR